MEAWRGGDHGDGSLSPKRGLSSQGPPHCPGPRSPRRTPKCPRRPQGKKPQPPHGGGPASAILASPGPGVWKPMLPSRLLEQEPGAGNPLSSGQGTLGQAGGRGGGPMAPQPLGTVGVGGSRRQWGAKGRSWDGVGTAQPRASEDGHSPEPSFPREEKGACPRPVTQTPCPPPSGQVQANVDPEENHQLLSLTPSRWTQRGHRR